MDPVTLVISVISVIFTVLTKVTEMTEMTRRGLRRNGVRVWRGIGGRHQL